jgi:hypothetical protein
MRLNRRLNLVVPVELDRGTTHVYSNLISREVFEQNVMLIGRTHAVMWGLGLGDPTAGPRVAAMMLRQVGTQLGKEKETESLLAEIRRLSNVLVPTTAGYETIPFEDALAKKVFDDDDVSEVENAIVFFTVASWMHKRTDQVPVVGEALQLWGAQLVSSTLTEYASSLRTSTEGESSGAKNPQAGSPLPR